MPAGISASVEDAGNDFPGLPVRSGMRAAVQVSSRTEAMAPDDALFLQRAVKEAVHELGHTCGLGHCRNPRCVMFFSNTLHDTDVKGPGFCTACRDKLNRGTSG